MQFTTVLIASFAALAMAIPTKDSSDKATPTKLPEPEFSILPIETPKDAPLIDLWQDEDFLGFKFTGFSTAGTCENLHGTGFNNNVSSGKSRPGFRCTVWNKKDCFGPAFSFNEQGIDDLPSWIDNKASSWKCVKN
ncbi:hypothetical protein NA57DRAFT_77064 [Rhizodiscina lignyota]|uniref:Uncharacterized protein n=1 Tax=Rhizodiscina lignyota TaxID=1504668 RepID=A0A9P4M508_9PEZI|nr:hypothetical protein NA57DRAFT_77064 [Rhizodiscina lignyota]